VGGVEVGDESSSTDDIEGEGDIEVGDGSAGSVFVSASEGVGWDGTGSSLGDEEGAAVGKLLGEEEEAAEASLLLLPPMKWQRCLRRGEPKGSG